MPPHVTRLGVLRELAERGTVAATAQALAFTPSAVSQQLSALEREAGVVLLEREGRRLQLTDPGPPLGVPAGSEEISGTRNVAAFSSFARSLLPQAAAAMLAHERLELHVRDAEPQD